MMLRKGMFIGDRYEIIEQIGSGGMSDVYKAKCHKLNRFVAIKVLKEEFSEDKNFVTKFKVEAQSVAALVHPNIVNVYDVSSDDGLYYIVMEYIEGITLKRYIERKGKLGVKESVSIAIQVAQGIEAAHNNHIIHRDIKPQNILISKEGKVKVTDFGIARAASANTINSNAAMGSVHYISPEQARGGFVDEKSDIYSLGVTLYEMITGRVPFEGDSTVTIALQHIQDDLPPLEDFVDGVPVSVSKIIEKCTQKKPDRRYLKISSLISDLKKSLISPNEDFVQLIPLNNTSSTVMISDDEVSSIRNGANHINTDLYDDDDDEDVFNKDEEDIEFDEELDAVNPKLDKIITIGAVVAGVVILIIFILLSIKFLGGLSGCSSSNGNETTTEESSDLVSVPNLIGLTEDEITDTLKELGLGVKFSYEENNDVEEGLAISQSKDEGTEVKKNTTITVAISQGKQKIELPSLIGKTKTEAESALTALGLVPKIETEYNDAAIDTVFKTDPVETTRVLYGDTVTIYVSRGPESKQVPVPKLIGLTESEAQIALEKVGLTLGKTSTQESTAIEGTVIVQGYPEGKLLDKGISVDIALAKAKANNKVTKTTKGFTAAEIKGFIPSVKDGDIVKLVININDSDVSEMEKTYSAVMPDFSSKSFTVNNSITEYTVKIYVNNESKPSYENSFDF